MFRHRYVGWLTAVVLVTCIVLGWCRSALASQDVVEESSPLAVTINGRSEHLEALVVHPGGAGRFPVALIVNGHFPRPSELHPAALAHLAHDFAHRGWLAAVVNWRGYGSSSGALQDALGTCTAPAPKLFLDAHAADLEAALTALRARPDADPTTALGLGISIGGAAMLDLAAEAGHPLTAVVNISGGVYHNATPFMPDPACGAFEAELVRTIGTFGAAHVPTLWIYAENDPWFRPGLVALMAEAYRRNDGLAELKMLPPFRDDGHMLFLWEANAITQPLIDQFLRAHGLPAMAEDGRFAPFAAARDAVDRDMITYYLRMPTEKALAVPSDGSGVYLGFAQRSIDDARRQAMLRCMAASRGTCRIAAENETLIAP